LNIHDIVTGYYELGNIATLNKILLKLIKNTRKHISLKLLSCQTRVQFELLDEQPAQNLDCGVLGCGIMAEAEADVVHANSRRILLSISCIRWDKFDFASRPWVMFYLCYNMHTKKVTKYVGKKRRSSRVNQTTHNMKYEESAHVSLVDQPISQPNLDKSPMWTPIIEAKIRKLQLPPV
jgi:hypothetical protein